MKVTNPECTTQYLLNLTDPDVEHFQFPLRLPHVSSTQYSSTGPRPSFCPYRLALLLFELHTSGLLRRCPLCPLPFSCTVSGNALVLLRVAGAHSFCHCVVVYLCDHVAIYLPVTLLRGTWIISKLDIL